MKKRVNKENTQENNKWYIYVTGVIIIIILLMLNSVTANKLSFDLKLSKNAAGYNEYSPRLSLPAGNYTFQFNSGSEVKIVNPDGKELGSGEGIIGVQLNKDESNIIIKSQSANLSNVQLTRQRAIFNDYILYALLIAAMLLYIGYIKFKKNTDLTKSAVIITLIATAVFASYPSFENYIIYGQDLNFHLYRIEGIKDGLLSGQFPVRIDPAHNNGYGYLTASIYPSLFLYFPALLRLCGISLVTSYKIFLLAVNIVTAFIMYVCAKKMTKSTFAGVFAAIVYTLSTWRCENLFYRAAIGEALAMTFFPVVILGLYYILKDDKSKWWVFAVGCSAIFHSHIISCIFVVILTVASIIVFLRDFLQEKRYIGFIKAAVLTLLINLWYLIPFIIYYIDTDLSIHHTPANTEYFSNSIFPAEMFNFFNDKFGYSQLMPLGIKGDMSLSLGVGVTFCFVIAALYTIFAKKSKLKNKSFYSYIFLFGLFIMFMASTLFPSELLQKVKLLNAFAGTVRMPWRLLSLASPIMCVVAAAALTDIIKTDKNKALCIAAACIICSFSFAIFGESYTTSFDAAVKIGQAAPSEKAAGWDDEYFIRGTSINELLPEKYAVSDSAVRILSYDKNGTNIELEISGAADGKYIEVPLLYYPGYSAKTGNGERLTTELGKNNVLRVNLKNSADKVKIKYGGNILFKLADIVSLLTVLFIAFVIYKKRKGQCVLPIWKK